jgi:predicted patatin/cPLA2 family phospholipase
VYEIPSTRTPKKKIIQHNTNYHNWDTKLDAKENENKIFQTKSKKKLIK